MEESSAPPLANVAAASLRHNAEEPSRSHLKSFGGCKGARLQHASSRLESELNDENITNREDSTNRSSSRRAILWMLIIILLLVR